MRASASIFPSSSSSLTLASPNTVSGNSSSDGEASPSFEDVLQQQAGVPTPAVGTTSPAPGTAKIAFDQASAEASISTTDPGKPTSAATTSVKNNAAIFSPGNDLSAMIIQAAALASNAQRSAAAKTPSASAETMPTKTENDSHASEAAAKNSPQVITATSDLSTLIAQVSMLASNASQASVQTATSNASTALGKELPLSSLSKASTGNVAKEKKSAAVSSEGSFIQSGTATSGSSSNALSQLTSLLGGATQLSISQQVAPSNGSTNSSIAALTGSTSSLAGTANVEKMKAMNDDLNFPEVELLSGYGANTPTGQSPADLHIQLSSNNDFQDALTQVMHVAQLTQTSETRTPMRVEMEIQTPPGAIVNVYVSKQNDQWRAQLSTNDPQALSWVQDQMTSLRQSNNIGVEVKWLPPQMESAPTSSGGQDANLSWDRGGQGQSNYQQPDDRQQSGRQKRTDTPELTAIQSNPFMTTLTALGRAA